MVRLRHRTQLWDRCFKAHLLWLQISFLDILKLQIHDWSSSWAQNFQSFLLELLQVDENLSNAFVAFNGTTQKMLLISTASC